MSGKNPAFQFYPLDYTRDTRVLTTVARGVWVEVLCALWWTEPGVRSKKLSIPDWSRLCCVQESEFSDAISQFERHNICDLERHGNGDVTLTSRRMVKDDVLRADSRKRKAKFDAKKKKEHNGNAPVTDKSQRSSSSSSSSVTKVTLSGEGDLVHEILQTSEVLRRISYEQDLEARRASGVALHDARLPALANKALGEALLMGDLDHPAQWWRRFIEREVNPVASSSSGLQKKESPAPRLCNSAAPEVL